MKPATGFYKFIFVLNLVIVSALTVYCIYAIFHDNVKENTLALFCLALFLSSYFLTDLTGLNLIGKLNSFSDISKQRIIWISILLFFLFIAEIFLGFIIYDFTIKIMLNKERLFITTKGNWWGMYLLLSFILLFITAVIAFINCIRLLFAIKKNYYSRRTSIEEIGKHQAP